MAEAAARAACDLCGLDCGRHPLTRAFDGAERRFCCLGCQNVYVILKESGVLASGVDPRTTDIFQQSQKLGLISSREERAAAIPPDAETREVLFHVSGMWCASCGWLIERALEKEPGVLDAEVRFISDLVRVRYCPQYVPPTRIPERIAALGYRASEYSVETGRDSAERRDLLLRIGIAFFLWMNVMLFSLPIYASYWEPIGDRARRVVPLILFALATPAVFYSAWPILRAAWLGVRNATLRMEVLLALGILSAYGYSTAQVFVQGQHYYFDTACAIVTLVLLGKLMERGAKAKTAESIALLYRMMPKKARVVVDGRERFVSIDALQPGMAFLVKTGERIPADGVIASGETHVDESVLTGESTPRARRPGDAVICGSLNESNAVEVTATRAAADSTLSQMIRSVEAALQSRSEIERTVDRVSRWFVPAVMAVALATVAAGVALHWGAAESVMRGIAVLVIACPCALGVATPLAITAAVGTASRRGILVSDSRVLETIRNVDLVVLDKTGTLTRGDFRLLEVDDHILPTLAAVEAYSEHPLGRAVVARAQEHGAAMPDAAGIEVRKGLGITGVVAGGRVVIGNRRLLEECGFAPPPAQIAEARRKEETGATVAFWAAGHRSGLLVFGDSLRDDARALVDALHTRGIRVAIVSGDSTATTAWAAQAVGADEHRAEALPAQKAEIVAEFQRAGRTVAMLGDGVNDAPALAAANLGIALGSGADIAMQAAPVVLMQPSLARVIEVFELAHRTRRIVAQNLFWAFVYNAGGIALAIAGILNPILAAGAMVLSSLSVIGNSSRLNRARYSTTTAA
jgi:heavy metal translocating P-type ATPase